MSLTPQQLQRAMQWFQAMAGKTFKCPICKARSWKVERDAGLQNVVGGKPSQRSIRVVVVGCMGCGHLLLFNASILVCELPDSSEES